MGRYYSKHDDAIKTFFAQCKDCTDMAGYGSSPATGRQSWERDS